MHRILQAVTPCVFRRLFHRILGDIQPGNIGCPGNSRIQRKGSHVRKAVQYLSAPADTLHGQTVVLLIQKKSGFLPVHPTFPTFAARVLWIIVQRQSLWLLCGVT